MEATNNNHSGEKMPWLKIKRRWLQTALKMHNANELKDYISAIIAFSDGEEYEAKTQSVDLLIEELKEGLQRNRKAYFALVDGGAKGGMNSRGAKVNQESITENQEISQSSLKQPKGGLSSLKQPKGGLSNIRNREYKNLKTQPQTPPAGRDGFSAGLGAGLDFNFLGFFQAYEEAAGLPIPEGVAPDQADKIRWRCTDGETRVSMLSAVEGLAKKATGGQLISAVSMLLQGYERSKTHHPIPFQAWKLCGAVAAIPDEALKVSGLTKAGIIKAFSNELEAAAAKGEGEAAFKILQGKAAYITENKVSNISKFLAAR